MKKIKALPDDLRIEICSSLPMGNHTIQLLDPVLTATKESAYEENIISSMEVNFSEEGPNKEEILDWLNEIQEQYN